MSQVQATTISDGAVAVTISRSDLVAAWSVLENLAVSLDQIGGSYSEPEGTPGAEERRRAMLNALEDYLTPELAGSINEARMRLVRYIPDDEAEDLTDRIPYWDYASLRP